MWMAANQTPSHHQSPNPPQQAPLLLFCPCRCIVVSAKSCTVYVLVILRVLYSGLCPAEIHQQQFQTFGLVLLILVSFPVGFH
jgi:hypothetical protein